jgi:hypothetical protein
MLSVPRAVSVVHVSRHCRTNVSCLGRQNAPSPPYAEPNVQANDNNHEDDNDDDVGLDHLIEEMCRGFVS